MSNKVYDELIAFIREHYQSKEAIPLHAPCLGQTEKKMLIDCIDSTFVSSVGKYVDQLENQIAAYCGVKHAIAVTNGTLGLYLGLRLLGVQPGDLVLTQSLTFVATLNAVKMHHADPYLLDVDENNLGLSAQKLAHFLENETRIEDGECIHISSGKIIRVCMPMHTLGFPAEIDRICKLCRQYGIAVLEDAAEALGSRYYERHLGSFGDIGVLSFNGNKVITTGGGGMLLTDSDELAYEAKHLSTTAKMPHAWLFEHDEAAYNLRMPNLNAALGLAQLAKLADFLKEKRLLASEYQHLCASFEEFDCLPAPQNSQPNFWLNALRFPSKAERDEFLEYTNKRSIQTRPLWTPMHLLKPYQSTLRDHLPVTEQLAEQIVNLPSGVRCV
ncbi:LegC family aminotransferase [Thiomicrorhabdus heinhorstiae]|uniref:LegC family aminotransferase n=1 Tax=Thiomicrorhabdus heinhorstiae TaxID=2748010 RepID=A0ABS0BXZ4_9GAMM|nr:LegC family aminotransferase [Thiomicrorhabdus heinhorstiae]MBF6058672.1 LegC family aminotransferase [Thiomicrorhabdus heinhorstiae]